MGYDLCMTRDLGDKGAPDHFDDVVWFCCGWDKVDLYREISCLGTKHADGDFGWVQVDLSSLAFVSDIERRLSECPAWVRYRRIYSIDEMLAEDWLESRDVDVRADMAIAFVGEDDNVSGDVSAVVFELYRISLDGCPWFVSGLAKAIEGLVAEGCESVCFYGG